MSDATLDTSQYLQGSEKERVKFSRNLLSCFERDGHVILRNHGISDQEIQNMFKWGKQFFDLPLEIKRSCRHLGGIRPVRGFNDGSSEKPSKLYAENEHLENTRDALESFNVGPLDDVMGLEESLPTFQERAEMFYGTLQTLANTTLAVIEVGLGIPQGAMLSRVIPDPSEMRVNHDPSIAIEELRRENVRRIQPHTDFGIITLLFQDSAGGLEFEDRSRPGCFEPVNSEKPSDLIVSIPDVVERWTNGLLRAGLHRVSIPMQYQEPEVDRDFRLPPRYSLAYFQRPGEEVSAGPFDGFVTEERKAAYDDISAREHRERRNKLVY